MDLLSLSFFSSFWTAPETAISLVVFLSLVGGLLLGLVVGYERSYHGRAAGMRTYGLVCMAAAGLTAISGYPGFWYGGHHAAVVAGADPTRVIQGIVTGIGFLGAGVIMKEGFNISGLTTAASIWASSAIGVLVGVGFYPAAILLSLLAAASMMWIGRLENWLPVHHALAVTMHFRAGYLPREDVLRRVARERGYDVASGSIAISWNSGRTEWRFVAVALSRDTATSITALATELAAFDGVEAFNLGYARN
jgi:putative Mg2+ transporter-C (MgtC) family protein